MCLAVILILGDVEENPGPPNSIADEIRKGTPSRAQDTTSATKDSPAQQLEEPFHLILSILVDAQNYHL